MTGALLVWLAKRAWCWVVGHDPRIMVPARSVYNLICSRCDVNLGRWM